MTKILIVDDVESERLLIEGLLTQARAFDIDHAADGAEALTIIRGSPTPDIVLTDLQMPNVNGLELVTEIRRDFPLLPVVLVTSRGSEDIAAEALRRGASSYVPKADMAEHLLDTVEHVLEMAAGKRENARLAEFLVDDHRRQEFNLGNDRSLFTPLVNLLQQQVTELGVCSEAAGLQIGIALDEALVNALYHGNLELDSRLREESEDNYYELARQRMEQDPYRDRRIRVTADVNRDQAMFVLEDDGPGFNPGTLPDPTDPENLTKLTGRGILLMRTFMDEVEFNDQGNRVTLVKKRAEPE